MVTKLVNCDCHWLFVQWKDQGGGFECGQFSLVVLRDPKQEIKWVLVATILRFLGPPIKFQAILVWPICSWILFLRLSSIFYSISVIAQKCLHSKNLFLLFLPLYANSYKNFGSSKESKVELCALGSFCSGDPLCRASHYRIRNICVNSTNLGVRKNNLYQLAIMLGVDMLRCFTMALTPVLAYWTTVRYHFCALSVRTLWASLLWNAIQSHYYNPSL